MKASWAKTARSEGVPATAMAGAAVWMASASAKRASRGWTADSARAPMTAVTGGSVSRAVASAVRATLGKTARKVGISAQASVIMAVTECTPGTC